MNTPLFCEKCDEIREYVIVTSSFSYEVKREKFFIKGKRVLCTVCGEDIFHLKIEQENQKMAFDAYRDKYHLLKPEEIKEIRDKYQLSQCDFSLLLGFNAKTIARFERGSLQTVEQNKNIRLIKSHSQMLKLLKKNGDKISEEAKSKLETSSGLAAQEASTVIQFNEETNLATVYTESWTVARTLKKAGFQPMRRKEGAWWFQIPVHAVSQEEANESIYELINQ